MLDLDTFLTTLYVLVDDSIKLQPPTPLRPGHQAHLTESEVVTLALMAQWKQFRSERAFVRYAVRHLRAAFPTMPHRTQLNRLIRDAHERIVTVGQAFVTLLGSAEQPYEVLDGMGVAVRNNRRIGPGWLDGIANTGWSNRLGWYDGFHVLTAVDRTGVVTGYAVAPASTKDQPYAEDFLAARALPHERLPMVGRKARGPYLGDRGFEGRERHRRWFEEYGAEVLAPPRNDRKHAWPRDWCEWHARLLLAQHPLARQIDLKATKAKECGLRRLFAPGLQRRADTGDKLCRLERQCEVVDRLKIVRGTICREYVRRRQRNDGRCAEGAELVAKIVV